MSENAQASKFSDFLNSLGQQNEQQDQGDIAEQSGDDLDQQEDVAQPVYEQPTVQVYEQPVVRQRIIVERRMYAPAVPAQRQRRK